MPVDASHGCSYHFDVHGIGLRVNTGSPAIASTVSGLLKAFPRPEPGKPPELEIHLGEMRAGEVPLPLQSSARFLCEEVWTADGQPGRSHGFSLYQDEERKIAEFHERGWVIVDGPGGRAEGWLVEPGSLHPILLASYLRFVLADLLSWRGLFRIHAAALEKQGRGVLIAGGKGRGKTTSSLALLRGGYRHVSDDQPLLRADRGRIEVLPFFREVKVTEWTLGAFPELKAAERSFSQGLEKKIFDPEDLFPGARAGSCEPAVILLPRVAGCPQSRLEPLNRGRALEELLVERTLPLGRAVGKRQFEALSRLAGQTDCYRLHLGEDILGLPILVDAALSRSCKETDDRIEHPFVSV